MGNGRATLNPYHVPEPAHHFTSVNSFITPNKSLIYDVIFTSSNVVRGSETLSHLFKVLEQV